MSYTPTNWQNGDVITAEKLNKLENGVAQGGSAGYDLVLTETFTENSKTMTGYGLSFDEIIQKIENNDGVLFKYNQVNTIYGTNTGCSGSSYFYSDLGSSKDLQLIGIISSSEPSIILEYTVGEFSSLCVCGYTMYAFTHDPTSKEYTFTFTGYAE